MSGRPGEVAVDAEGCTFDEPDSQTLRVVYGGASVPRASNLFEVERFTCDETGCRP